VLPKQAMQASRVTDTNINSHMQMIQGDGVILWDRDRVGTFSPASLQGAVGSIHRLSGSRKSNGGVGKLNASDRRILGRIVVEFGARSATAQVSS
jgi:hypothetical protein